MKQTIQQIFKEHPELAEFGITDENIPPQRLISLIVQIKTVKAMERTIFVQEQALAPLIKERDRLVAERTRMKDEIAKTTSGLYDDDLRNNDIVIDALRQKGITLNE